MESIQQERWWKTEEEMVRVWNKDLNRLIHNFWSDKEEKCCAWYAV
jgi:hypothetical protein